jgi:hypothetical protein
MSKPTENWSEQGAYPELNQELGGPRFYLAGEPLHAGELLEMLTDDGS